jgi:hypothetical protein
MVPAGPGMIGTSQFFTQAGLSIFVPGALSVPAVAAARPAKPTKPDDPDQK